MIHKIEIDWKMKSPFMQVLTGEVRVGQIDMGCLDPKKYEAAFIKKENGIMEYRRAPSIISRCKPLVDVMVRSYFEGMLLKEQSVVWFDGCHRHNNVVTITMND